MSEQTAEAFFYEHSAWNHHADETPEEGRQRCANEYAEAERTAKERGWQTVWHLDSDADNEPGEGYFVSGAPQWEAALVDVGGNVLASLCGIDLGWDDEETEIPAWPYSHPYGRVVHAQLADEALRDEVRHDALKAEADAAQTREWLAQFTDEWMATYTDSNGNKGRLVVHAHGFIDAARAADMAKSVYLSEAHVIIKLEAQ